MCILSLLLKKRLEFLKEGGILKGMDMLCLFQEYSGGYGVAYAGSRYAAVSKPVFFWLTGPTMSPVYHWYRSDSVTCTNVYNFLLIAFPLMF